MTAVLIFTAADKHREALREMAMRQRVYARRVEQGQMTTEDAAQKIAIMAAIADDYSRLAEKERLF